MVNGPLTLYEEILLLALDDAEGTTTQAGFFTSAMGGAILAELALKGSISIADDKKKKVTPGRRGGLDDPTLDDPILNECLALVTGAKKPKNSSEWVIKFANLKDLKHRVARQLVIKGVLTEETDTVLMVFKRRVYPEVDGGPEQDLRRRMEKAILDDTSDMEARTVVIIALAQAAGMLNKVFPKRKLKERKERLEQLCTGQLAGQATKEAVQAIQAAILVVSIMPAVFVATS
jgi:hypothetical protein